MSKTIEEKKTNNYRFHKKQFNTRANIKKMERTF